MNEEKRTFNYAQKHAIKKLLVMKFKRIFFKKVVPE